MLPTYVNAESYEGYRYPLRSFQTASEMRTHVRAEREAGRSIGFVPTMGALHEGHLTLIRRARAECETVVVSVFVNPTQFGPAEDFTNYPRDIQRDSALALASGADALFAPSVEQIHPEGSQAVIDLPALGARWEGADRPGHFAGVATVCAKLFNIVRPDRAFFGLKDYQQLKVIQRMVTDLHTGIKIVPCPTVRDADGLAMSSRNAYLTPEQRAAAVAVPRALDAVAAMHEAGERSAARLQAAMAERIAAEPLAAIAYAAVTDPETLEPSETVGDHAVALIAVRVGATRLIDNRLLGEALRPSARP